MYWCTGDDSLDETWLSAEGDRWMRNGRPLDQGQRCSAGNWTTMHHACAHQSLTELAFLLPNLLLRSPSASTRLCTCAWQERGTEVKSGGAVRRPASCSSASRAGCAAR